MGNKFYTPEIEELHIGFEVQKQMQELISKELNNKLELKLRFNSDYEMNHDATFANYTITANDIRNYDLNPHVLKTEIRVKYLDREDLESIGWIKTEKEFNPTFNDNVFFIEKQIENGLNKTYRLRLFDDFVINIFLFEKISRKSQWLESICLLNLIQVKNKSELQKIMKMLNIQ